MLQRKAISELKNNVGKYVKLMGTVKRIRVVGNNLMFIVLKDYTATVQLVVSANIPTELTKESSIEIVGKAVEHNGTLEIQVKELTVLNKAINELPFEVNCEDINANLSLILDNRAFSVRNEKISAIFKIQSTITSEYASFLNRRGFTSIRSPKIVAGATESGSSVFNINYFGKNASLAQSPQFYKQMMVGSNLERVYEIGPVFRAESHNTSRHINEYTSMDLEIGFITDINELMELEQALLNHIIERLNIERRKELELLKVYPLKLGKVPILTLNEALTILKEEFNYTVKSKDIDPEGEKLICQYVKEIYDVNAVFLTEYPTDARPFYTMPSHKNSSLTQSFDLIFNGVEITTGGLRIHNYNQLITSANTFSIDINEINSYLSLFRLGMPPHGGFAIGLERLTAQLLGIDNIKEATLFPRDKNRLTP